MAKNIHTVFNSGRGMWENKKKAHRRQFHFIAPKITLRIGREKLLVMQKSNTLFMVKTEKFRSVTATATTPFPHEAS